MKLNNTAEYLEVVAISGKAPDLKIVNGDRNHMLLLGGYLVSSNVSSN